jgi:hypothetical protein
VVDLSALSIVAMVLLAAFPLKFITWSVLGFAYMGLLALPFLVMLFGLTCDGATSVVSRVLQQPPARWLGTVSYSLYLSHTLISSYPNFFINAVEEAMQVAAKHEAHSEPLVAEAKDKVEQARAAEAGRARVAAEEAAAAAAVKAAAAEEAAGERLQKEEELAALTLRMQTDALRAQQVQAQLGVPPAAPAPHPDAEETLCVVCFDAPKQYAMLPSLHMCACEACARSSCSFTAAARCAASPSSGLGRCSPK